MKKIGQPHRTSIHGRTRLAKVVPRVIHGIWRIAESGVGLLALFVHVTEGCRTEIAG